MNDLALLSNQQKRSLPSIHRLSQKHVNENARSFSNIPRINEKDEESYELKRKSLNLTDTNVNARSAKDTLRSTDFLSRENKMKRSFASKDDLTLHWEQGEKNVNEGENQPKEETKNEKIEEEEQEEIQYPTGVFKDHIVIAGPPAISARFSKISCKQIYAKLLHSKPFWEFVLEKQENKNGSISELHPSKNVPNSMVERDMTFVTPIKGAPMGPKETRVEQHQRISMPSNS